MKPTPRTPESSPVPKLPAYPVERRFNTANISFLLFIALVVSSLPVLRGSGRSIDPLEQLGRFMGDFFPPDLSVLPSVLVALWETIQIAAMATVGGLILALLVGVAAARTIAPRALVLCTRLILNGIRTIPSLIWAVIAVALVGANSLAGVIGLTFYSLGYLGKFFSESFESLDMDVVHGLRDLGAGRWQAFQFGLWPVVKPLIWSHTLWMLEYNIRSASIIGYVGAGGIGLQLLRYQEFAQWDRFATVLICIFIIVVLLDTLSGWVRRHLARSAGGPSA
jgi:phosphonate transport system permease protein